MRIKKYLARDTQEAYQAIRADLGHDAVILDVKEGRDSGLLGMFRPRTVEVLAAANAGSRASATAPVTDGARGGVATLADPRLDALSSNLDGLRQQVEELTGRISSGVLFPRPLQAAYERLAALGVEPRIGQRLLMEAQEELSARAVENEVTLWKALRRRAADMIRVRAPLGGPAPQGRPVFLVGPTGVGKTTTLAKLAATLLLKERRSVALISTDTFRVGAVAQLQVYAEILGVPLSVAYTPRELAEAVAQADAEYVLVDTPGCSQHNAEHLREMRPFIEAVEPREVLLALGLNTVLPEALEVVDRFQVLSPDGLIVTKLDEARTQGALLALADRIPFPLAYFTTGQQVPQDIEAATPMGAAAWALWRGDVR